MEILRPFFKELHIPLIISDNDFGDDCDGVMQMAVMWATQDLGECTVLAVTDPNGDVSSLGTSQHRDFYGQSSIPVGRCLSPVTNNNPYYTPLPSYYPNSFSGSGTNIPDAVAVMRAVLNSSPANSVTLYTGAPETNISNLLSSIANYGGDGLGTGASIIAAKVLQLVIMGGDYPTGLEGNMTSDPASAYNVAANFPRPIIYLGYSFGASVTTGSLLWVQRPAADITYYCCGKQMGVGNTRSTSWDHLAFLFAVRGTTFGGLNYFNINGPGINTVNASTGANSFSGGSSGATISYTTGTENHYYLSVGTASYSQIGGVLDKLIAGATQPTMPVPMLFWQINETSGTTLADSGSGAHIAASIVGTPTFGDHYLDMSGNTTGTNFYAQLADANCTDLAFLASQPFTVLASLNRAAGGSSFSAILQRGRANNGSAPWYGLFISLGSPTQEMICSGAEYSSLSTATFGGYGTGVWYTMSGGQDGTNCFLQILEATLVTVGTPEASNINVNSTGDYLQAGNDGSVNEFFVGYLGNLRVYGVALTVGETSQAHVEPISATVPSAGTTIQVVMPLYLSPTFTTDDTGWYVLVNGVLATVSSAAASGRTLTLNMASPIQVGQTVVLAYYSGATVDTNSNRLLNFAHFAVINNTGPSGGNNYTGTSTDAPSSSDTAIRALMLYRSNTDTPSSSDVVNRLLNSIRTINDVPSSNDTASRLLSLIVSVTDSPSSSDTATRALTLNRSNTDTPSSSDAASRLLTLIVSATDSPASSDACSRLFIGARLTTETPGSSDTAVIGGTSTTVTDSPSSADAVTRLFHGARITTDAPGSSDAANRLVVCVRSSADSPTSSDVALINGTTASVTDSPSSSDAITRLFNGARITADVPSSSDAVVRVIGNFATATDAPHTTDAATRLYDAVRSITDAPGSSDVCARSFSSNRGIADVPDSSDVAIVAGTSGTATDTPSSSDVCARSYTGSRGCLEDPVSTDTATRFYTGNIVISHSVTVSDYTAIVGVFNASFAIRSNISFVGRGSHERPEA